MEIYCGGCRAPRSGGVAHPAVRFPGLALDRAACRALHASYRDQSSCSASARRSLSSFIWRRVGPIAALSVPSTLAVDTPAFDPFGPHAIARRGAAEARAGLASTTADKAVGVHAALAAAPRAKYLRLGDRLTLAAAGRHGHKEPGGQRPDEQEVPRAPTCTGCGRQFHGLVRWRARTNDLTSVIRRGIGAPRPRETACFVC